MLYFHAYVHHSLTCDVPLEIYVVLNGDSYMYIILYTRVLVEQFYKAVQGATLCLVENVVY